MQASDQIGPMFAHLEIEQQNSEGDVRGRLSSNSRLQQRVRKVVSVQDAVADRVYASDSAVAYRNSEWMLTESQL